MKPFIPLVVIMFFATIVEAQVTYRSIPEATQPIIPYDSLENIPVEHVKSLYGQKILALHKGDFRPSMDVFSKIDADKVVKKQFDVVKAMRNEKTRHAWLMLASGADTIYYQLNNASISNPTFITIGYFEKQTKIYTGKKFKLRLTQEFKELNSGIIKTYSDQESFVCTGSTIIQESQKLIPSLTLKSDKGDEIYTPIKGFHITTANNINLFTIE